MPIPDYQTAMLPVLRFLADGKEHSLPELVVHIEDAFNLTEEEKTQRIPSGRQNLTYNRVAWSKSYLKSANLLEVVRRGYYKITQLGLDLLKNPPEKITRNFLVEKYSTAELLRNDTIIKSDTTFGLTGNNTENEQSPEESIDAVYESIQAQLSSELLDLILSNSPTYFEKLVVDLVVSMGYGGNRKEAGRAVGKSNDEGIDGVINEDRLGLDSIYIQAKRWKKDNIVGRNDIQAFVGALAGKQASKGIFITTSAFTKNAREYVKNLQQKVILIDGLELTQYMIEYNVGVSAYNTYTIKKVDYDYFEEI